MKPPFRTSACALFLLSAFSNPARAQVFSENLVGYINYTFPQGDTLFGNQLANNDNSLNLIFPAGNTIPDGTTISLWDSASRSFLQPSVFNASSGWSINYTLPLGQGALLHTPDSFVNTFVGNVIGVGPFGDTIIPPPPVANGLQLLACRTPFNSASFYYVTGRSPLEGDSVTRWDNATGTYLTTTFVNGDWNNGAPDLNLMEAAFFNLGNSSAVPEPSSLGLLLVGGAAVRVLARRRHA